MPFDVTNLTTPPSAQQLADGPTWANGGAWTIPTDDMNAALSNVKSVLAKNYPIFWRVLHGPNLHGLTPSHDVWSSDVNFDTGHGMVIVGYNDSTQQSKFLNSWGKSFGDSGYGYIPYSFFMDQDDLQSDLYVLCSKADTTLCSQSQ